MNLPSKRRRLAHLDSFSEILAATVRAKRRWGLWVETVTNVIPDINDDDEQFERIASWIRDELGPETPWHVTRFVPHLRLSNVEATPVGTLGRAREIGLAAGDAAYRAPSAETPGSVAPPRWILSLAP